MQSFNTKVPEHGKQRTLSNGERGSWGLPCVCGGWMDKDWGL